MAVEERDAEVLGLQEQLTKLQQELEDVQEQARQSQPRINLKLRIVDASRTSSSRAGGPQVPPWHGGCSPQASCINVHIVLPCYVVPQCHGVLVAS